VKVSERKHRAFIPRRDDRSRWTDLDYMREISDASDCGHQGWAETLLAEFNEKFLKEEAEWDLLGVFR
jgi:hypothetical protein